MTSLPCRSPAVNACGVSPSHGLFGAAGEDGGLECFDLRSRDSLGWLDAAAAAGEAAAGGCGVFEAAWCTVWLAGLAYPGHMRVQLGM